MILMFKASKVKRLSGLTCIILLRIMSPFAIYLNPFWGLLFANFFDFIDVILLSIFKITINHATYTLLDKLLDTWLNVILMLNITNLVPSNYQTIAYILFIIRFMGIVLAINLNNNKIFLFTPNFFYYFLGIFCFIKTFNIALEIQNKYLFLAIFITFIFNFCQEILLHFLNVKPWQQFLKKFKS